MKENAVKNSIPKPKDLFTKANNCAFDALLFVTLSVKEQHYKSFQ